MFKGIYLTLMIGPAVPVVAPKVVMDALTNIQVTNSKERNGFQISFTIGKNSPILTTMLMSGYFDPIVTRVMIIATMNGIPNVLIDGFITNHEVAPSNEAGKSTLTITGEDVSVAMDLVEIIAPFIAMPDIAKIYFLLAPFAALGVVPLVIPPLVSPLRIPTDGWDSIVGKTHRQYLKSLASRCGYIFFIQPGPLPGQNIAYFGPDINLPVPQPALSINLDAHSNIETLNFSLNGLAKRIRIYVIYDSVTHKIPIPIPVPNINVLKPPMGVKIPPILKTQFSGDVTKYAPDQIAQIIIGDMISADKNPPMTTANGSLDVNRYKGILRMGMMVGVRGAGIVYDGMYYVDSVTHTIKPGEYKQSFTLSRDGIISNTPVVPV
jgi:hypothetical protein